MARCFKCHQPCLLFPACPEHAEELFTELSQSDARVTQALERVEAKMAFRYRLEMPCRDALIERWLAGELEQDALYQEWRVAHFNYLIQCGSRQ